MSERRVALGILAAGSAFALALGAAYGMSHSVGSSGGALSAQNGALSVNCTGTAAYDYVMAGDGHTVTGVTISGLHCEGPTASTPLQVRATLRDGTAVIAEGARSLTANLPGATTTRIDLATGITAERLGGSTISLAVMPA